MRAFRSMVDASIPFLIGAQVIVARELLANDLFDQGNTNMPRLSQCGQGKGCQDVVVGCQQPSPSGYAHVCIQEARCKGTVCAPACGIASTGPTRGR
eukprot:6214913-Alexandrium_andersonii.AAC.1